MLNSHNSPNISSQQRGSSPWIIAVASSSPAPAAPGLSCAEGFRAGHRTPGDSYQSGAEGQNSPLRPHPAGHTAGDAAQGMVGLLGCEQTLLGHAQLFINQQHQALLSRAALNPFIPQPILILGIAPTEVQGHYPCWISWVSHRPTSRACPGPSGWHCIHSACRLHHSAWCHLQTCWGCTRSWCLGHWRRY